VATQEGKIKVVHEDGDISPGDQTTQRLDKWLWFARVVKTRSLAQKLVLDGRVRVNRERTAKPAQTIHVGDLVSVELGQRLRLFEVLAVGARRGPASEAADLFRDLAPPAPASIRGSPASGGAGSGVPSRDLGTGRPTKLERRRTDRLRDR